MNPQRTIRQLLESRARQTPEDVFAIWEDRPVDFRQLQTSVYRLANGLAKIGVGAGRRVAVMLNNHADHVFTFFALSALGAVWVPVNVNLRGGSLDLPGCIDYAEQRIYRELDLQVTRVSNTSTTLSSGVRTVSLSTTSGTFVVVEQFNVWNSTSATSSNATRVPLTPVTKEFMGFAWPTAASYTGVPIYYAPLNNTTYLLGPAPSAGYTLEIVGTIRPTPLSSGNSSTFLTQNLPDVFMAASMIFASAYMRDFGGQSDNPQMAASWEHQYQTLMQSANAEELRKRFMSQGWTVKTPNPIATPPRM